MRTSQFLIATQKETPADAEVISHQLMLRAGLIRKLAAGLYTWLPLGLRVLRKVEAIVRQEMDELEIDGLSGAGMVAVTLSGKGLLKRIKIDPSLLKDDEVEMLEDLIVAAHNDAKQRLEEQVAEKMGSITGGLPLPPGFKLPF